MYQPEPEHIIVDSGTISQEDFDSIEIKAEQVTEGELMVVEKMKRYGGSFVKALANCYRHADPINREKIISTWPEYWANYRDNF